MQAAAQQTLGAATRVRSTLGVSGSSALDAHGPTGRKRAGLAYEGSGFWTSTPCQAAVDLCSRALLFQVSANFARPAWACPTCQWLPFQGELSRQRLRGPAGASLYRGLQKIQFIHRYFISIPRIHDKVKRKKYHCAGNLKISAFSFPHFKCIILINYPIHWRMLCQNTMAVRVKAAASPSHFRMTSWSAPTAARPITASATRSWASASTAPPTPPAASGSSPTRRASSAPVRPAASAPCGMRKPAAAAVLCFPPRGRSLLLPAAAAKRPRLLPDVPSVRHFRRPGEGVF